MYFKIIAIVRVDFIEFQAAVWKKLKISTDKKNIWNKNRLVIVQKPKLRFHSIQRNMFPSFWSFKTGAHSSFGFP